MARKILFTLLLMSAALLIRAQQSANYKIDQSTFNNGGNPSPVLTSSSYQVTLDCVGDGLAATGLSSSSYGIDSGTPADDRPPGEVTNLLFTNITTMTWNPEPSVGSYNLYSGDVTTLPGTYGTKSQSGIASPTTTDSQTPASGHCLFYLVTATNRVGEEGPKGH